MKCCRIVTCARANRAQQLNPLPSTVPTYFRVFNAWATSSVRSLLKRSQSIDREEEEGKVVVDKRSPVEVWSCPRLHVVYTRSHCALVDVVVTQANLEPEMCRMVRGCV